MSIGGGPKGMPVKRIVAILLLSTKTPPRPFFPSPPTREITLPDHSNYLHLYPPFTPLGLGHMGDSSPRFRDNVLSLSLFLPLLL